MARQLRDYFTPVQPVFVRAAQFVIAKRQRRELKNVILIFLGALSAAMGLHGFLESSKFIDGGVTGISMLLAKTTPLSLSVLLPILNLPFIALGYRQIGLAFAIRSTFAIALLALILEVGHFPDVTDDKLLTSVFGGVFIGAGIGLAIRGGAVLDGTEIAALLLSKRSHLLKVGDIILIINVVIFFVAMFVLGVNEALYSILTYVTAAKTLDFILNGIEQFTAISIISEQSDGIRHRIMEELGRGVTIYKAKGGRSGLDQDVLFRYLLAAFNDFLPCHLITIHHVTGEFFYCDEDVASRESYDVEGWSAAMSLRNVSPIVLG